MTLQELEQLRQASNSIMASIESLKYSLQNNLDQISSGLSSSEVLKVISNQELQILIDLLVGGGEIVGVEYPTTIVPYPKPLEFIEHWTNPRNSAYEVYANIFKYASGDIGVFTLYWLFYESINSANYNYQKSQDLLVQLIEKIGLGQESRQVLQDALTMFNMNITIINSNF